MREGISEKPAIGVDMCDEIPDEGIVGDVASAFSGDEQLGACLPHLFQYEYPGPQLSSPACSQQAGRTSTYYDYIMIVHAVQR